mmetsp:Transcript_14950/g.42888  ORF Transcript_14950/g.42888 Transcript_14950/m.42888 type:complete len:213 (+) Transcript_14950:283-921(+)
MPGGVLATSGEVGKASEEACGVLTVSNKIAPAAPKRRARGGKAGSRARRLENFRQHKAAAPAAAPAIKWEQLAHGLLRQQRATLRDGARAAWVRMRAARAKIGAAVEQRLRMSMQQEVATHQALTPQHRRRRALAAALHNAPAQEGPLLLAALCSATSGQRCTRRTHGVLSEPRGGGRPSEREPHRRPCPAQRRASGTEECNVAFLRVHFST